jgi:VWFA-related protein
VTTVQAKVRVVLVDVVVTSGKGDSVTGLHKEDFEVSEDGKLQTIASFAEHQGAPPTQIKLPYAGRAFFVVEHRQQYRGVGQFLADTAAFQAGLRTRITLQALQQPGRYLSEVPGRKNVIWFSGSFPVGILPDPDLPDPFAEIKDFQQDVRKTTALLTAAQVALYPIVAEGFAPDSQYEANRAEIGEKRGTMVTRDQIRDLRTERADRDSSHAIMETLAKDTGGQAYYNTNGLNDVLARVINNGTRYYTISYSPTTKATDGKYRRIQVKLVTGKDKLAYRRGYYADDLEAVLAAGQSRTAILCYR